jgi:hypothetical protein
MDHGSSDRIPASALILTTSILFTLISYVTFKGLWKIDINVIWLLVVLGFQFATLLLGSSKILTQLGAASLSALIAVAACIGAVFLIFPPLKELQIAGAVGGGSALLFILASFVAASRVDPVSSSASETFPAPEPLFMENIEEDQTAELIKYGEVETPESIDTQDLPLTDILQSSAIDDRQSAASGTDVPQGMEDKDYEFDDLSESKLGVALGVNDSDSPPDPLDLDEASVTKLLDETLSPASRVESPSTPDPSPDHSNGIVIPDDWVKETASSMAYDVSGDTPGGTDAAESVTKEGLDEKPDTLKGVHGFKMRARYKILDAASGEHYGTYYSDEGYSTLDPVSLIGLVGSKLTTGELRIVKLDWSNFDEVEVHISVEEVVPIDLDVVEDVNGENGTFPGVGSGPGEEAVPDSVKTPQKDDPARETGRDEAVSAASSSGPRYMIYDRRTIQPMGEYIPEGDRPRIDRLTLYRMLPEYNFKTFEIDSVRWEDDEVRIFIKGEKKESPKSKAQSPKRKHGQRDLLEDD